MRIWIDIEDPSGNKLGGGPITTALFWESVRRLDRAGTIQFGLPAADSRANLLQEKRRARAFGIVNGAVTELGVGIIDRIQVEINSRGQAMLEISGDDILRELTYRHVEGLEVGTETVPATTGPNDIAGHFPGGWSLDTVTGYNATAKAVWHLFEGETALAALIKLVDLTGEHFRLGSSAAGAEKLIWMQNDAPASGLRATRAGNAIGLESEAGLCLIGELEEVRDSYEMVSRIYPYGAGEGDARYTLSGTTWTPPSGYTLVAASNYIKRDSVESAYERIDAYMSFKDIEGPDMLAEQAYEWLERHSSINKFYRIKLEKVDGALAVGSTIRVTYHRWVDGYHAVNIDTDLRVLEVKTRIDGRGFRTTEVLVATVDRFPNDDADALVGGLTQAQHFYTKSQPLDADSLDAAPLPGVHAATHVTGGGDTIAGAVSGGNSGLMSGADKALLDNFFGNKLQRTFGKAGISDNVATGIFSITTTNESGSADAGGYVCHVRALIMHSTGATSSGLVATKYFAAHFSREMINTGVGVCSAVTEEYDDAGAANSPANRDIGDVIMTAVENGEYEVQVNLQIDLTGASVAGAQVVVDVTLLWYLFATAPTLAAL